MSSDPIFPQEIFDNVVDQFCDDPPSLRTCALVAPAWLSASRTHLFYEIRLQPPKSGRGRVRFFSKTYNIPCENLLSVIENSAKGRYGGVAPYVKEVYLCEGMGAREWFAFETKLPALLRNLNNLRRFEIARSASVAIPWGQMAKGPKAAIQDHVLALSSLTELKLSSLLLDSLGEWMHMLKSCNQLRSLEVDHISFKDEDTAVLDSHTTEIGKAPLDVLRLGARTSPALIKCLLHPSSGLAVNAARRLTISISGNFEQFGKLLQATISVEELEMVLMNDVDLQEYWVLPPHAQFDLSQLPQLKKLKINIDVLQKMDDPLPWINHLLHSNIPANIKRTTELVDLFIVYALYLPAPYMDRSVSTTIFDNWSDIDAVLSPVDQESMGQHAYSKLERVRLHFMLENPIGFGIAPRFMKEVVLDSPGLHRRRMLEIKAFDTSG